jgi:hypothetical protein
VTRAILAAALLEKSGISAFYTSNGTLNTSTLQKIAAIAKALCVD